jgi:hypothetical protein
VCVGPKQLGANTLPAVGGPAEGSFSSRLIDCEEDRTLRAVLVGMLRETERLGSFLGTPLRSRAARGAGS